MLLEAKARFLDWATKNRSENLIEGKWPPPLETLVEQAKEQWQQALAYFDNVKDPELVDLAINNLEAAEKHYNYLLRQLREQ